MVMQFFAYAGFVFASALVVLRIVAIWERNKFVVAITGLTWLTNVGACIRCAITMHSSWDIPTQICRVTHVDETKWNILFVFIIDMVLLTLMIIGLLRWDRQRKGDIGNVLFKQGLAWVFAFVLAEVPPVVFIFLNLNNIMDLMFQYTARKICLAIMTIGATRIHRGLSDHFVQTTVIVHSNNVIPAQMNTKITSEFVARPGSTYFSTTGGMRGGAEVSVMDQLQSTSDGTSDRGLEVGKVDGETDGRV
ncbi:hypothetical protein F5148DRAFT_1294072 [Russula earlei]|uniref:Uncharacterized protein n=1 Tax=Russula earlei TaxID=71964 RepID=A0ACC0TTM9_9AGAM|nr:hypothetical protein F5148DRAFT_1294072 [Russula earlei]